MKNKFKIQKKSIENYRAKILNIQTKLTQNN